MTGGEGRRRGRGAEVRRRARAGGRLGGMDAETWLLEPFLLKLSGAHWTLLSRAGGRSRVDQCPSPRREEEEEQRRTSVRMEVCG